MKMHELFEAKVVPGFIVRVHYADHSSITDHEVDAVDEKIQQHLNKLGAGAKHVSAKDFGDFVIYAPRATEETIAKFKAKVEKDIGEELSLDWEVAHSGADEKSVKDVESRSAGKKAKEASLSGIDTSSMMFKVLHADNDLLGIGSEVHIDELEDLVGLSRAERAKLKKCKIDGQVELYSDNHGFTLVKRVA